MPLCVHACVRMRVCMFVCTLVHLHVHVHECVHVCVCVWWAHDMTHGDRYLQLCKLLAKAEFHLWRHWRLSVLSLLHPSVCSSMGSLANRSLAFLRRNQLGTDKSPPSPHTQVCLHPPLPPPSTVGLSRTGWDWSTQDLQCPAGSKGAECLLNELMHFSSQVKVLFLWFVGQINPGP